MGAFDCSLVVPQYREEKQKGRGKVGKSVPDNKHLDAIHLLMIHLIILFLAFWGQAGSDWNSPWSEACLHMWRTDPWRRAGEREEERRSWLW